MKKERGKKRKSKKRKFSQNFRRNLLWMRWNRM